MGQLYVIKIGMKKTPATEVKISQENNPLKRIEMRNIWIALTIIINCSVLFADSIYVPNSHTELLDIGTNTHTQIDTFIASKGQPGGIAALNGSGTIEISGYVAQNSGTGTGNQFTNISIVSGTGTLSGVPAPYIAQANGTSTGGSHTSAYIYGSSTIQSTSTSNSFLSGNLGIGTNTPGKAFVIDKGNVATHTTNTNTVVLIKDDATSLVEIATPANASSGIIFSRGSQTGGYISYSHILDRFAFYAGDNLTNTTNTPFTVNSSGSVTASNLVTGWRAGSTFGYGLMNLVSSGDIVFTPTYDDSAKSGTITASLTGTASAKPNLLQDGVLKATAPGTVSFNLNFYVTSDGSVTAKNLVQQTNGTSAGQHLTNVQIASGTGTLCGVPAPYVAQISGTATLLVVGSASVSHNGAAITGGAPTGVDVCIGDNDTGINWVEDGKFQLKTNSNILATLDSSGIPSTFDIGTSGHNVNVTHYGSFTCKNTIESQAGGIKFPDGTIQKSVPILLAYTYGSSSAITTGIATIPDDNTVPQSTEGTSIVNATHTVTNANNILKIRANVNISVNENVALIAALFNTGTSNAMAATRIMSGVNGSGNKDCPLHLEWRGTPGTTTPLGYSIRVGAPSGTIRSNASAQDGLGRFGGNKWINSIDIEEYTQ